MNISLDTWMAALAEPPGAILKAPLDPLYTVQTQTKAPSVPVPCRDYLTSQLLLMRLHNWVTCQIEMILNE